MIKMSSVRKPSSSEGYRAELDGIRALAVMSVIVFHFDNALLTGGFIGVDVFFVLSGYFICGQIFRDVQNGEFSLLDFYDRRVRRLLPALFTMLVVTTVAAIGLLWPTDLKTYSIDLVAAVLSLSNINFWLTSGYFSADSEKYILLHTWSLGVEEQFYILFPPTFVLLYRKMKILLMPIFLLILGFSFLASIYGAFYHPSATFYLLPTRMWEIGLGGIVALPTFPLPRTRWHSEVAAVCGLLLILASFIYFSEDLQFPGIGALPPCIGSTLIIWAGKRSTLKTSQNSSIVAGLLGSFPFTFVGLLSYSLYLWHWPFLAFWRYSVQEEPASGEKITLLSAIFLTSFLSYRFIEAPLRRGDVIWRSPKIRLGYSMTGASFIIAVAAILFSADGLPQRLSPKVLELSEAARDISPERNRCHADGRGELSFEYTCVFGSLLDPQIIVFADSHGVELAYALAEWAIPLSYSVRQLTASACPPAVGFKSSEGPFCDRHVARMLSGLQKIPKSTIVFVSNYNVWIEEKARRSDFWDGFEQSVQKVRRLGHDVFLIGGVPPHHSDSLPQFLAAREMIGDASNYRFVIDTVAAVEIDEQLRSIAAKHGATYVPIMGAICGSETSCSAVLDKHPIYFDGNHLTLKTAADLVASLIGPTLLSSGQK